jgi:Sec7-like guanine-nucleotide exchange factor
MDFYSSVAQLYMSGIDFHDLTVDEALRQLLLRVKLPGSSQFIRRILKGTLIVRSPTRFSLCRV